VAGAQLHTRPQQLVQEAAGTQQAAARSAVRKFLKK
jgi:hypothetical protein